MPVRSLSSPVLRWPDLHVVEDAARRWAERVAASQPQVLRVAYFGSYARGDWGVGSDLDLIVIVARADEPFERRGASLDTTELPVPAEVLVYTKDEWDRLSQEGRVPPPGIRDAVWIYER